MRASAPGSRGLATLAALGLHGVAGLVLLGSPAPRFGDRSQSAGPAAFSVELVRARHAAPASAPASTVTPPSSSGTVDPIPQPTGKSLTTSIATTAAPPTPPESKAGADAGALTAQARPSAMPPGALSYRDALSRHLAHYRLYPPDARRQRLEGTVRVRFLLERDGRVSQAWVDNGSGHRVLDAEAEASVLRASPFPAIPDELPDRLDITLPISFSLG